MKLTKPIYRSYRNAIVGVFINASLSSSPKASQLLKLGQAPTLNLNNCIKCFQETTATNSTVLT